jgi:hypothetical protein
MQIADGITDVQDKVVDLSVVEIEGSWVDGNFKFFQVELADSLIAHIPRIHKKLSTLVLPNLKEVYFQIFKVLSVLPLKIVSVFFEYARQRIVPECPVKVWMISLDLGSISQILIVRSAEPEMTKIWLNIFSLSRHLTSPLCIPA